jgi:hypothetical protein
MRQPAERVRAGGGHAYRNCVWISSIISAEAASALTPPKGGEGLYSMLNSTAAPHDSPAISPHNCSQQALRTPVRRHPHKKVWLQPEYPS